MFGKLLDVILDVFSVGGDHRAVKMISCVGGLVALIRNAGVKYVFNALLYQPLDMPVYQFCRVTLGFTRYGFNSQLVNLPCGLGGQDGPEPQFFKENSPERIILIHIENTRDSHGSPRGHIGRQWFKIEHSVVFIFKKIGNITFGPRASETALTPVAGYKLTAAVEAVDGEHTVIGTALASGHVRFIGEAQDLVD